MIISIHLFGSAENIFYAGQNISGNVRVETHEEIKMRGIRLEVTGEARVHWSEGGGKNRRHYSGHEHFIELKTYLTGSDGKDSEMMLQPGVHTLPLSFLLPNTLPSSFEGIHGSIKYKVKAVVDRPWKIDDSTEILLTVIHWLNLNNEPQLREPIVMQGGTPMVGCCYHCCCIKGFPETELRINKGGFVPGETIIVSGQVVNNSNTTIEKIFVNFIQEIQFCATSNGQIYRRKFQYNTLGSIKRPQIESGRSDTFNDVTFTVPPVVESRLEGSSIINIAYYIQVKANFSRGCADSSIRRDVVIGHVPLQGDGQYGGPIATQPAMYASPFHPATAIPEHPSYTGDTGVQVPGWDRDYIDPPVDHKN